MNTSGDRLRALLRECHLTATDFAANRKVTPQHVNNWFKRGIPMARLDEVAELLTVNARWLRTGEGPKHPCDSANDAKDNDAPINLRAERTTRGDIDIPIYKEMESATGAGKTVVAEVPGHKVRLPLRALQTMNVEPANAACITMAGNSMADKIQDGSLIGIDRGLTHIIDGEMYALDHDGMLRVKHLYRLPGGGLRLRSQNSDEYPDETLSTEQISEQSLRILGWVFWWSTLNNRRPPTPIR